MKLKSLLVASALLTMPIVFTACDDIQIDNPTPASSQATVEKTATGANMVVNSDNDVSNLLSELKSDIASKGGETYVVNIKSNSSTAAMSANTIIIPKVTGSDIKLNFDYAPQTTMTIKAAETASTKPVVAVNKLTVSLPAATVNVLNIDMPETTVTLESSGSETVFSELTAKTASNTLIVGKGVTIKVLTIMGGTFKVEGGKVDEFRLYVDPTPSTGEILEGLEGLLAGSGSKAWTWDTSINGVVWGNMGYCGGSGADVALNANGQWWGVTSTEEFNGQLVHTEDGINHGDGDLNAYMVFYASSKMVNTANSSGFLCRLGEYELEAVQNNEWKVANLKTDPGTILWPYEINSGGNKPTIFEVVYLTEDQMTLVYPDGGDFGLLGSWSEATFWRFKKK